MRIPVLLFGSLLAVAVVAVWLAPATAEMIVYMPMDGNVDNVVPGSTIDPALVEEDDGLDPGYVTGHLGMALDTNNSHSDGLRDYVQIPYQLPNAGTIVLWHYTEGYSYNTIFDNSGGASYSSNDYEMYADGYNRVTTRMQHNQTAMYDLDNLEGTPNWYCYAVTWEKLTETTGRTDLYIDCVWRAGKDITSIAGDGNWRDAGDYVYLGGGNHGNRPGDGLYDEVRIFDTVLTPEEICDVCNYIPEPSTLLLLVCGMPLGMLMRRRKR